MLQLIDNNKNFKNPNDFFVDYYGPRMANAGSIPIVP